MSDRCVSCDSLTNNKIKHKDTKIEYPFCYDCYIKGLYNKDIFRFMLYG